MDAHASGLVWVIADGIPCHVSVFAALPPKRRPHVRCPQCTRRLTLKLGNVRRHHAAHDPGDVCAATRPETALHINCKLALAAALRAHAGPGALLSIVRHCAGDRTAECSETLEIPWVRAWEEVFVEHRLGDGRRPDIVLARGGEPLAAVEVVASNEVSAEKEAALAALSLPWIEVLTSADLSQPAAWSPRLPLRVARAGGQHEWRCRIHEASHRTAVAAAAAAAADDEARRRELQRSTSVLRAARVVDVYHEDGSRERYIFRVTAQLADGQLRSVELRRGSRMLHAAPLAPPGDTESAAWPMLRLAFAADVEGLARGGASFADSPMRWATGAAAENIVEEALADRFGTDPTPLATRYPRRWFFAKATQRWFLPSEMRDVRWDRGTIDAFAAHPAWTRGRSTIRERPAPEGSWQTPVFASRPTAAMFLAASAAHLAAPANGGNAGIACVTVSDGAAPCVILVVESEVLPEAINSLSAAHEADGVCAVWLSHPLDWCSALAPLVWVPAGRDQRGHGGVVIDGLGIFRAEQFVRALARADPRVRPDAIRRRMANRVAAMRAAAK